jgi:hypothetical protein
MIGYCPLDDHDKTRVMINGYLPIETLASTFSMI